jgi:murein DD-endopeptidase MepM/ murein hydrolase activator NlpD
MRNNGSVQAMDIPKDLKELYRYTSAQGKVEYFNAHGESTKKALLRTPINGARVTSGYAVRQHPMHGYSHFHQALDYGAKHGTPILAAGDGIVEFTKSQHRGYGRHVRIKHNGTYSTLYAHMSRFANNIHPGSRVEQGQVIGYVGATGDATGPHLHYEVIEKGKKIHPNKATFTKLPPLKGPELKKFLGNIRQAEILVASLEKSIPHNVAMAPDNKRKVR